MLPSVYAPLEFLALIREVGTAATVGGGGYDLHIQRDLSSTKNFSNPLSDDFIQGKADNTARSDPE